MADPPLQNSLVWTLIVLVTALFLALVVGTHIFTTYWTAYMAAPREMATFIDAVDFSIQENESYDRDVACVQRLEDKIRLGRLLREIQKGGDDLREDLNQLLVNESGTVLKTSARILWAGHRRDLEERVRRLDLLRMRFLVVYMGIVATTSAPAKHGYDRKTAIPTTPTKDPEKAAAAALSGRDSTGPSPSGLPRNLRESIKKRPPLRRITTQAMGHNEEVHSPHRKGWIGVVQELQRSPLMHKRHASIESAMAIRSPPLSPLAGSSRESRAEE